MKKIVLVFAASMMIAFAGLAQDKKMSIGLGFGGASAAGKDADGTKENGFGFNFYLNGMYNINENFSAGLEYNGNAVVIGDFDGGDVEATAIRGILAKAKYAFGEGRTRPFIGLMAGMYTITPGTITANNSSIGLVFPKATTFGFAPEVGIQLGAFQFATSYHLPGKYKESISFDGGDPIELETTYSVWQFNIGWNIGIGSN